MKKAELVLLLAYNRWANEKVRAACQGLSSAQVKAPAQASFGSLLGTLAHIFGAEEVWRTRLQEGVSPLKMAGEEDFRDLAALEARWSVEEAAMAGFVDSLAEEDLERKAHFRRFKGDAEEATVWKALLHVVMHGMQFRAEAGVILAAFGRSPGDIDLIYYLREVGER